MQEASIKNRSLEYLSGLTETQLISLVTKLQWPSFKAQQIHSWIYKKCISSIDEMTDLSVKDRDFLNKNYKLSPLELTQKQISEDKTIKYLWKLNGGNQVESVRMFLEDHDSYSACISSQVGCAVGCPFCATGKIGFKRNLKAAEIVDQILGIQKDTKERISNVVFMGQGEPLLNYDEVLTAMNLIKDSVGIGARHITLSTSGIVPNIKKLADEKLQITLAISLHAPDQRTREILVPISKKYPISELMESLHYYYEKTKRRITIEYVMLDGINDQIEKAKELSDLIKGLHCHINLIPYNPIEHSEIKGQRSEIRIQDSHLPSPISDLCLKRPPRKRIYNFKDVLEKRSGKKVTVRKERGVDIAAACGQLANIFNKNLEKGQE